MLSSEEASLSSPQKLESPTFHAPSWYTASPVAPFSTVAPAAWRSYVTVACVDEVTFTESTLAETAEAIGLLAKEATALENVEPSWSRASRWLSGVDELKNFSQLVVMAAAGVEAAGELELEVGLALELGVELELPLEQAVIAATSTSPIAGAR